MLDDGVERLRCDQTEIAAAGQRPLRLGFEFVSGAMQVDLLAAEGERHATAKLDTLHAKNAHVKTARRVDIGDGQHDMINAVDLWRGHCKTDTALSRDGTMTLR